MFRYHYQHGQAPAPVADTFYDLVLAIPALRFYFPLDEPSGTSMLDAAGSFDGSYVNTPTLGVAGATSDSRTAVAFAAASSEYGQVTDNASILDLGTGNFSLGFFCKFTAAAATNFIMARAAGGGSGSARWEAYRVTDNAFRSRLGATNIQSGTTTKNDGAWHLAGLSVDRSGNAQWYLDGTTDGAATDVSSETQTLTSTGDLYIAARSTGNYLDGSLQHAFMAASLLSGTDWSDLWAAK